MAAMFGGAEGAVDPSLLPAQLDAFIAQHDLNNEAADVLLSLSPEIQQTVMKQFSPKSAQAGTYEMNGKLIMFARSVERGSKGKGKDGKGKDFGKGFDKGKGKPGMDAWGGMSKGSSWEPQKGAWGGG